MHGIDVTGSVLIDQDMYRLLNGLLVKPLESTIEKTSKWNKKQLLSYIVGFTLGDASIDRRPNFINDEVMLETSKVSTILPFLSTIIHIVREPIKIRFYIRKNSYGIYKMRVFTHVFNEYIPYLVTKDPGIIYKYLTYELVPLFFIAGFFDSDGSIQIRVKSKKSRYTVEYELTFYEFDPNVLGLLNKVLETSLGINGRILYGFKGKFYRLRIYSRNNIYRLVSNIHDYILNYERYCKIQLILQNTYKNKPLELKKTLQNLKHSLEILRNRYVQLVKYMIENKLGLYITRDSVITTHFRYRKK